MLNKLIFQICEVMLLYLASSAVPLRCCRSIYNNHSSIELAVYSIAAVSSLLTPLHCPSNQVKMSTIVSLAQNSHRCLR